MGGLVNVLNVELGDEGSLDGGTTGGELRGVQGGGLGGGGVDGAVGEERLEALSDLGGVGRTSSEDDLIDVKKVDLGLGNDVFGELNDLVEERTSDGLVTETVDGGVEVVSVAKRVNSDGSGGGNGKSTLDNLTLELQLGQRALVLAGVGLVLLDELLGEVVDEGSVETDSSKLVVVGSGEDGVHSSTDSDDGGIGAGSSNVGNEDDLVGGLEVVAGSVGKGLSNGLLDNLKDLDVGVKSSGGQGSALGLGEVGGDGDDSLGDGLSQEVGGGGHETPKVTGGDLLNGDVDGGLSGLLDDGEGNLSLGINGVGGVVGVGGVDLGEPGRY